MSFPVFLSSSSQKPSKNGQLTRKTGLTDFWRLAWNLNQTADTNKVFCTKTFPVPPRLPFQAFFKTKQEELDATDQLLSKKVISQKFVDLKNHSQYPMNRLNKGILPNGMDEFIVLPAYEKVYERATTLCKRFAEFEPGGEQGQLPPRHDIILSGAPRIGKDSIRQFQIVLVSLHLPTYYQEKVWGSTTFCCDG